MQIGFNRIPYQIGFTPGGNISSHALAFGVPLKLGSKTIQSNLIAISLEGMDVILGMD
jgi:hypothetical protein